jgi:hypothetical protein
MIVGVVSSAQARDAAGSSFGALTTGRSLMKGSGLAGLGVGIGMDSPRRNAFVGSLHYGLFDYIEVSGRAGLTDDDEVRLTFYGDFKYQLLDGGTQLNDPLDLAFGGFFEYRENVYQLGVQAIGSRLFKLQRMQTLEPYARFNVRVEGFRSGSNIEVGVNAGLRWGITRNISLFGELQLDGNDGVFIGLKDSIF